MKSQEIIELGNQASRVLNDQTVLKVFETVRQKFLALLETSELGDRDLHHEITLSLQALRSIRRELERWVTDAEVERRRNPDA